MDIEFSFFYCFRTINLQIQSCKLLNPFSSSSQQKNKMGKIAFINYISGSWVILIFFYRNVFIPPKNHYYDFLYDIRSRKKITLPFTGNKKMLKPKSVTKIQPSRGNPGIKFVLREIPGNAISYKKELKS